MFSKAPFLVLQNSSVCGKGLRHSKKTQEQTNLGSQGLTTFMQKAPFFQMNLSQKIQNYICTRGFV